MKYLYYKTLQKTGQGLLDRRSCLLILLAESKLSNRVAVIPKFILGSQHNNGKNIETYLINVYFNIDKLEAEYIWEEDFLEIEMTIDANSILDIRDQAFRYNSSEILIRRNLPNDNFWNLKKLHDVISLAKKYHGVGVKYIIPLVKETDNIKNIGDKILNTLVRPIVGLHLRRGDRLNNKLSNSMNENTIINKFDRFKYNSVYYCSNDLNYKINDNRYFSNSNFKDILGSIEDNFLLFCIEMYVVDNSDISVRTFNDSSPFYFIENKTNKNYSICDYGMNGSHLRIKSIPNKLIKCNYEDYSKDTRKSFSKPLEGIPLAIGIFIRILRSCKYRIKKTFNF